MFYLAITNEQFPHLVHHPLPKRLYYRGRIWRNHCLWENWRL